MSSTMEKVSSNQVKLRIELGAEAFEDAIQAAYQKIRGRINVPGFRRGKAPRKVIERMYGESVFYEEAFDMAFPDLYAKAIKEHDIKAVDQPDVDIESIGGEAGLVVNATLYVQPEVTLGEYKGLDVQRPDDGVDEEAVDQEVSRVRQRNAREEEVQGRPVQDDDIVTLDYAGTVDGVAFEGGTAQGQTLQIGSGSFIPGFEEQMVGMAIGDEKDLAVTFPKEYHQEDLSGKEAVFHVKVHGIKTREMPDLDDEFAKDVSEFDTLDAYKASIRAKLQADASRQADVEYENQLVEAVLANAQMDVPPPMIEREIDALLQNMSIRMMYQGIRMQDFLKYTGQTEEELREQHRNEAEKHVKGELALQAIRKAEGIEASEADVDALIAKYAEQAGKEFDAYKADIPENQIKAFQEDAIIVKVLDFLKANAKNA